MMRNNYVANFEETKVFDFAESIDCMKNSKEFELKPTINIKRNNINYNNEINIILRDDCNQKIVRRNNDVEIYRKKNCTAKEMKKCKKAAKRVSLFEGIGDFAINFSIFVIFALTILFICNIKHNFTNMSLDALQAVFFALILTFFFDRARYGLRDAIEDLLSVF